MECPRCNGAGEIDDASVHIGDLIRHTREARGLTQEQLAERVGLSRTQVTNIEVGRSDIPLKRLQKFAAALGCSMKVLVP